MHVNESRIFSFHCFISPPVCTFDSILIRPDATPGAALQAEHQKLQATVEERHSTESRLGTDLERAMREKAELEVLLDQANALARQHMSRENQALIKVQEALQIADTAIEEKNSVAARERGVRQECDFLATTIGQVMEQAAQKVEQEMNALRVGYENRISALERQLEQLKSSLEQQRDKTSQSESRARALEDKFKGLIVTNQNLDADLHAASKLIVSMWDYDCVCFVRKGSRQEDSVWYYSYILVVLRC